jgi:hypothetical protein
LKLQSRAFAQTSPVVSDLAPIVFPTMGFGVTIDTAVPAMTRDAAGRMPGRPAHGVAVLAGSGYRVVFERRGDIVLHRVSVPAGSVPAGSPATVSYPAAG